MGLFYQSDDKPSRLYNGFVIYIIVIIDIFLLLGVCLGMKLDKQQKPASGAPRLSKAKPADATDTKIAFGDKEEQANLSKGDEDLKAMKGG